MSGFHSTYAARDVNIVYAGVDLSNGKGEDVYLTIERSGGRVTFTEGADGRTAPSINPTQSGNITLTLFPTSQAGKMLTAMYEALIVSDAGDTPKLGALPLTILDPSGATFVIAEEAVFMEIGSNSLGLAAGSRDYKFYVQNLHEVSLPAAVAGKLDTAFDTLEDATNKLLSGI